MCQSVARLIDVNAEYRSVFTSATLVVTRADSMYLQFWGDT
jgi:hypothetical protein